MKNKPLDPPNTLRVVFRTPMYYFIYQLIAVILVLVVFVVYLLLSRNDYKKMMDSVCCIRTNRPHKHSCGSGVVFKQDKDWLYILTAGHIVGSDGKVHFMHNGWWMMPIRYEVIKATYTKTTDLAVLRVSREQIKKYNVRYSVCKLAIGAPGAGPIISAGFPCTEGSLWKSLWIGRIGVYKRNDWIELKKPAEFQFFPCPEFGRSGSPLFVGGKVVGIIIKRFVSLDYEYGLAMDLHTIKNFIYEAMNEKH